MSNSVEMSIDWFAAPLKRGEPGLRRAVLVDPRPGEVRIFLEDDFHHFELMLGHDGRIITEVAATTIRHPWTTCAGAAGVLAARLRGVALAEAAGFDSALSHCTHLYDLALFAASKAEGDRPELFRMFVADPAGGPREAILDRDGDQVLAWRLEGETILPPNPHGGLNLRQIRHWAAGLPRPEREAALLLRRAAFISIGRTFDPDVEEDVPGPPLGACYAHQPEVYDPEARFRGSRRNFDHAGDGPLAARVREIG